MVLHPQHISPVDLSLKGHQMDRRRVSTVNTASFEEGLGRVMYVAGALEH